MEIVSAAVAKDKECTFEPTTNFAKSLSACVKSISSESNSDVDKLET